MKVLYRVQVGIVLLFFAGLLFSVLLHERATYRTLPPWDIPQYRNACLGRSDEVMPEGMENEMLYWALVAFNNQHVQGMDNPSWHFTQNNLPRLSTQDRLRQQEFINVFVYGWDNDVISLVMPFNSDFIRTVLARYMIYFASWNPDLFFNGLWKGFPDFNAQFLFIHLVDPMVMSLRAIIQPTVAIHEVGRALGLNDSLTVLFSYMFAGSVNIPIGLLGRWDYDNRFDRALMYLAGEEAFWRAAFTSDAAYGVLWDSYLGHVIPYETLMLARGMMRDYIWGDEALGDFAWGNNELRHAFEHLLRDDLWAFYHRIPQLLLRYATEDAITFDHLALAIAELHELADIAVRYGIEPYLSVRTGVVNSNAPSRGMVRVLWLASVFTAATSLFILVPLSILIKKYRLVSQYRKQSNPLEVS